MMDQFKKAQEIAKKSAEMQAELGTLRIEGADKSSDAAFFVCTPLTLRLSRRERAALVHVEALSTRAGGARLRRHTHLRRRVHRQAGEVRHDRVTDARVLRHRLARRCAAGLRAGERRQCGSAGPLSAPLGFTGATLSAAATEALKAAQVTSLEGMNAKMGALYATMGLGGM